MLDIAKLQAEQAAFNAQQQRLYAQALKLSGWERVMYALTAVCCALASAGLAALLAHKLLA